MHDCLFCRIVGYEIPKQVPAHEVYEDDQVLAFLDLHPVAKGHTLVVPKRHTDNVLDAAPESLAAVAQALPSIAKKIVAITGAEGFNVHINNGKAAGQAIFHLHWHIIPRFENDGLLHWPPHEDYAPGEAEELAKRMREG